MSCQLKIQLNQLYVSLVNFSLYVAHHNNRKVLFSNLTHFFYFVHEFLLLQKSGAGAKQASLCLCLAIGHIAILHLNQLNFRIL